jgi:hypothetical protein
MLEKWRAMYFEGVLFLMFLEVWLKVTYGAFIWSLVHGRPMEIIRGGMGFLIWM